MAKCNICEDILIDGDECVKISEATLNGRKAEDVSMGNSIVTCRKKSCLRELGVHGYIRSEE